MTTFQAIIYGILKGFTEFWPLSPSAHQQILPFLTGWPEPTGSFAGALALGAFLSLLVYFRHDLASILSCFLQVILFRKRPMTLDERLPIFLLLTSLPPFLGWYYLHDTIDEQRWTPLLAAAGLALFALPLWLSESFSRKNKGMFDWNILDAIVVGIANLMWLVPGAGWLASSMSGAMIRNYNREAAAKYAFFALTPVLAASAWLKLRGMSFHQPQPMPDVSWLTFYVTLVVTFLSGLLALGSFMKHVQRGRLAQVVAYRFVVAAAVAVIWFWKNRG